MNGHRDPSRRYRSRRLIRRTWSAADARVLVWAVWALLNTHGAESLVVREFEPAVRDRLEFVSDDGAVVTEPLALSSEALTWLQGARFNLAACGTKHGAAASIRLSWPP